MNFLKNKSILITGGTGSFGATFAKYLLNNHSNLEKIIIFSRDELKQYNISQKLINYKNYAKLRFFLGDIRDKTRLVLDIGSHYIIANNKKVKEKYIKKFKGKKVADSFCYRSNLNNNFLTISELRKIIKKETKNID
jgi:dTDP-D-glucose 4,6-dehydratase